MKNMIITFDYFGRDGKTHTEVCRGIFEILYMNIESITSFNAYYFDEQGKYVRETYFILENEKEYSKRISELYFIEKQRLIRDWLNQSGLNKQGYFDSHEIANKLEKLDSQKNEQNALLSVLGKIRDYANILEVPSNTTVEEFMKHTHMCSSRNELTAKLIEMMLYAEKENKGKRR